MSGGIHDSTIKEENREILESRSNVSVSATAIQSEIHNETVELVRSQHEKRVSECPGNGQEGDLATSGHPLNEECSSGDIAQIDPGECSEIVSLQPEPERLNEQSSPVRNTLHFLLNIFPLLMYLFCNIVEGIS